MNASSGVFISNVDDFIAPSQACVNPLYNNNSSANDQGTTSNGDQSQNNASVVVPRPRRRRRPQVGSTTSAGAAVLPPSAVQKPDPIKASIVDCLACSGCVTTAETVLLEQQHSLTALRSVIHQQSNQQMLLVATISPAVWADMLRHLQVPPSKRTLYQQKLATSLYEILQVSYVLDGNIPLQWSLLESAEEFCRAYNQANQQQPKQQQDTSMVRELDVKQTPSVAINSHETKYMLPDGTTQIVSTTTTTTSTPPPLPLITSSCPALVCLAEKSMHGAVQHLARTKSPMSMAGTWWRQTALTSQKNNMQDIFHLAFMPCHDKKLEASRKDFTTTTANKQDVDLVLTTQEWFQLLVEHCSQKLKEGQQQQELTTSAEESLAMVQAYLESLSPALISSSSNHMPALVTVKTSSSVTLLLPSSSTEEPTIMITNDGDDNNDDPMDLDADNNNNHGAVDTSTSMQVDDRLEVENGKITNNNNLNSSFFTLGSGGLAEFVFRYASWRLFDTPLLTDEVIWKPVTVDKNANNNNNGRKKLSARMQRRAQRSRDYYQATLYRNSDGGSHSYYSQDDTNGGGVPVLRFAIAYGLQTVQRAMEPFQQKITANGNNNKFPFDFVEAMACPSGCLNGGGQLRLVADRETPTQTRERVAMTRELFESSSPLSVMEDLPKIVDVNIPATERQTRFHVVPPLQHSLGAAAGVAVKDTQW